MMTFISKARQVLTFTAIFCGHFSMAQSYSDIYDALPDMTLDQAYSVLMEFQKKNPYEPNTYIQLGSICEKKMIHFDPLRDNKSVRFWADNANLFYGNLKVYYKKGDVRSEFYENLHIPFAGKKIEDADMWNYVEAHTALCMNHKDSTSMIYSAIERSKSYYDKCLADYESLCEDYINFYEMLLCNDAALDARLKRIGESVDNCMREFDEYKRLTSLYPVMNYNQFYDKKKIETFRLDGLTNSDFYSNRFFIWDFRSWIDDYYFVFNRDILTLRDEIKSIDNLYRDGRRELANGDAQKSVLKQPFDELFLLRLGRYDKESLVGELFNYLELTRHLILMAGDSIGRNIYSEQDLTMRKMRHLYNMRMHTAAMVKPRAELKAAVTDKKIAHFADFFKSNYGGAKGLHEFIDSEASYCASLVDGVADNLASYVSDLVETKKQVSNVYSEKKAKLPALPLWVANDANEVIGAYHTTAVSLGSRGSVANVAGVQKSNKRNWFVAGVDDNGVTAWMLQPKNINSVCSLQSVPGGCMVSVLRQNSPVILFVENSGKERYAVASDSEIVELMNLDEMSGRMRWVCGNERQQPSLSVTDSLGRKAWSATLSPLTYVKDIVVVSGGFLVIGMDGNGTLSAITVSDAGRVANSKTITSDVKDVIVSSRASANEIALLVKKSEGKHKYVIISQKGDLISM